MAKPDISIIGLGRAGTALLHALSKAGYRVLSAYSRTEPQSALRKAYPDTIFGQGIPENNRLGEVIFITVADDAIVQIAEQLALKLPGLKNRKIVHCSGSLSHLALQAVKNKGALTASFHPIKSINENTHHFRDIYFDMEGDEELLLLLEKMAADLGAHAFRVHADAKVLLHAAAVVASNYLVVLAQFMNHISEKAGLPEKESIEAFGPLMQGTLNNIRQSGIADALTGPIARGDVHTIEKHLKSLSSSPGQLALYKRLGREAIKIAILKSGKTDNLQKIEELLKDG